MTALLSKTSPKSNGTVKKALKYPGIVFDAEEGLSNGVYLSTVNPSYAGSRFSVGPTGPTMRLFADVAGNNDDVLSCQSYPTPGLPTANLGFTTVVSFSPVSISGSDYLLPELGHLIRFGNNTTLDIGYRGNNGFNRYTTITLPSSVVGKKIVVVISSKVSNEVSVAVYFENKIYRATSFVGLISYVGWGSMPTTTTELTAKSIGGWQSYYHLDCNLSLLAVFPGLFLSQSEAENLAVNPYGIYKPDRKGTIYTPPVQLSAPRRSKKVQPGPNVVVNWNHPLLATIEDVFVPTENGHVKYSRKSSVLYGGYKLGGGTITSKIGDKGGLLNTYNSSKECWYKTAPYLANSLTLIAIVNSETYQNNTTVIGNSAYYDDGYSINQNKVGSSLTFFSKYNLGGGNVETTPIAGNDLRDNFVASVWDGTTITTYVNGTYNQAAVSGTIRNTGLGIIFGHDNQAFYGSIGLAFTSSKATPLDVIRELERNPWQVFDEKPRLSTSYFQVIAVLSNVFALSAPRLVTRTKQPTVRPIAKKGVYQYLLPIHSREGISILGKGRAHYSEQQIDIARSANGQYFTTSLIYEDIAIYGQVSLYPGGSVKRATSLTCFTYVAGPVDVYSDGPGNTGFGWYITIDATNNLKAMYGGVDIGMSVAIAPGLHSVAIQDTGVDESNTRSAKIYLDGKLVYTLASITSSLYDRNIGPRGYGSAIHGPTTAMVHMVAVVSRDIFHPASLTINPWQIFQDKVINATANPPYLLASAPRRSKLTAQPRFPNGVKKGIGLLWATNYATDVVPGPNGAIRDAVTGRLAFNQDTNNYISGLETTVAGVACKYNIGTDIAALVYVLPGIPPFVYDQLKEFTFLLSIIFDGSLPSAQYKNFRIEYGITLDIMSRTSTSITFTCDGGGTWNGGSQQTITGLKTGDVVTIVASVNQAGARFFCNGKFTGIKPADSIPWFNASGADMKIIQGGYDKRLCQAMFGRALPDDFARSLSENPWQIFREQARPGLYSTTPIVPLESVSLQILTPATDVSTGAWSQNTGATLASAINELTASSAEYIQTITTSTCEVKLSAGANPQVGSGHVLRYQILQGSGTLTVTLKCGTTTIASWVHAVTSSIQDIANTLTNTQAINITDHADLRVEFTSELP